MPRNLQTRVAKTQERLSQTKPEPDYRGSIEFQGAQRKGNRLLEMPPGSITMGERRLQHPRIILKPGDRVGLIGPNGSGKSTLLEEMRGLLDLPAGKLVWIPQELEPTDEAELIKWLSTLPTEKKGPMLSLVSRLGSRPEQILGPAVHRGIDVLVDVRVPPRSGPASRRLSECSREGVSPIQKVHLNGKCPQHQSGI